MSIESKQYLCKGCGCLFPASKCTKICEVEGVISHPCGASHTCHCGRLAQAATPLKAKHVTDLIRLTNQAGENFEDEFYRLYWVRNGGFQSQKKLLLYLCWNAINQAKGDIPNKWQILAYFGRRYDIHNHADQKFHCARPEVPFKEEYLHVERLVRQANTVPDKTAKLTIIIELFTFMIDHPLIIFAKPAFRAMCVNKANEMYIKSEEIKHNLILDSQKEGGSMNEVQFTYAQQLQNVIHQLRNIMSQHL